MRLLVLNWFDWNHPLWGGAEVYLREVYRRLAARGHEVTLLCSTYAGCAPECREGGIRILRRGAFWTFHLQAPWYYRRELAQEPWDCVFEYTNKTPLFTPLYVKAPLVAVAHHLFGASIFRESNPLAGSYIYAAERAMPLAYRRTPWIAVSPSTRDDLVRLGIPAGKVHVVPNGIDASCYGAGDLTSWPPSPSAGSGQALKGRGELSAVAGEGGVASRPFTVAWIGRMRRYKRVDVLLRAMALLRRHAPEARLELAGNGPHAPALRALAEVLGLQGGVTFHGVVSEANKLALLRRADVLAQPSIKEGWGLTVLEAGACGVPAVAADVAGLRDSVRHGETGLLVRPGDAEALAAGLAALRDDVAWRRALGRAAQAWARRFTWDAAADATEELAERVVAERTGRRASPAGPLAGQIVGG